MKPIEEIKKTGKLKDGTLVILRPMLKTDRDLLGEFFGKLPPSVLQYVRHDVTDPKILDTWIEHLSYDHVFPLLALKDDRIVGNATLHRVAYGWRKHLGTIRVVVSPEFHGKGLGTLLVNELIDLSAEFGLEKLMVEVPLKTLGALNLFKKAGFTSRALIDGLMKDRHGNDLDVVIMVLDVAAYAGKR